MAEGGPRSGSLDHAALVGESDRCYRDINCGVWLMAQLLVRNLDEAVKEALRRRARCHGRSMEEEARMILCQAIHSGAWVSTPASPGLGSRMAALFAGAGLDWQGQEAEPADFGA